MIDYTITVGNIIEIGTIVFGGLVVAIRQQGIIGFLKVQVAGIENEIGDIQKEIRLLINVITDAKLLDQRVTRVEADVNDIRHGRGFVSERVSGEYTKHGKIRPITGD